MTSPIPKGRNRFIPFVGAAVVTLGLLFANLDGFHDPLTHKHFGVIDVVTEPPHINWAHGWPFAWVLRHHTDLPKPGVFGFANPIGGPVPSVLPGRVAVIAEPSRSSRWPFDTARARLLHWWRLLADIVICAGIIWGSYRGIHMIQHRFGLRVQFSLRQLMLVVLIVSVCMSFRNQINWQYVVFPRFSFAVVFGGGLLTTLTLASGVRAQFNRPSRLTRSSNRHAAERTNG